MRTMSRDVVRICVGGDYLASESAYAAPAEAAVTLSTAGHAPIFLASGWEAPNAPT